MIGIRALTLGVASASAAFVLACGGDDGAAGEGSPTPTATVSRPASTAAATTPTTTQVSTPTTTPTAVQTETQAATAAATEAPPPPPPVATQPPPPPPVATQPPPPPPVATQPPPPPPVATQPPPPPPQPTTASVTIDNFAFLPGSVTVTAGSNVVWTNRDRFPHDVTSNGGAFASDTLQAGNSFSTTFSAPGTYGYVCTIHPTMSGTVVVN